MNPALKNFLAVISGLLLGGILNMALVIVGGNLVPAPYGADVTSAEGLKASIHLFRPVNFLFPFLAHALGTLIGSAVAAYFATPKKKRKMGMLVGLFFMAGGLINVFMLPSPLWFNLTDLIFAYLPMSLLGTKISVRNQGPNGA